MAQKTLLSDTPARLTKRYYQALTSAGIPVEKIIIFGSYAKGTAKPYSDLDICVSSPIFGKDRINDRNLLFKISRQIDDMIEPHPYNPKDLLEKWDPLAEQIRKHGQVVINL